MSQDLTAPPRLGAHDGTARFAPTSVAEALHGTFALWDVLDALMRAHEPGYAYATGYVRELQVRRALAAPRGIGTAASRSIYPQ